MRKADEGVAPVVAVALLIGLVAVAGAIIGLSMFAALEDAAGTPPDVRFQVSADGKSLYHAGGDALPLKNLVFYDTSTKDEAHDVSLIKSGSTKAETSLDGEVWETGDRISFGGALDVLSIVGLDSRNRPALLYLGADAVVLPVGDMVPDEWTAVPPKPIGPTPVPTPVPTGGGEGGNTDGWLSTDTNNKDIVKFGDLELLQGKSLTLAAEFPHPTTNTNVRFKVGNAKEVGYCSINVTVFNSEWSPVFGPKMWERKNKLDTEIGIDPQYLVTGNKVYFTIEMWEKNKEPPAMAGFRRTIVITIT